MLFSGRLNDKMRKNDFWSLKRVQFFWHSSDGLVLAEGNSLGLEIMGDDSCFLSGSLSHLRIYQCTPCLTEMASG